jgi:hypothetical protein
VRGRLNEVGANTTLWVIENESQVRRLVDATGGAIHALCLPHAVATAHKGLPGFRRTGNGLPLSAGLTHVLAARADYDGRCKRPASFRS